MDYVSDQPLQSVGDETITGLNAVKTLTIPSGAVYALIQAQVQNVSFRDNPAGTAPTATAGLILPAGGNPLFYSGNLENVKLIEVVASARIFVTYYKPRTYAHGATPLGG